MKQQKRKQRNRSWIVKVGVLIILGYFLITVIRSVAGSIIFLKKDRLNIVFYGSQTNFVSIGRTDGVHYRIPFDNDFLVKVPGGYGEYKIGSLGKLAQLEKNPHLIKNAFSFATGSFVDFYFYPTMPAIYADRASAQPLRSLSYLTTLFSLHYKSNASLFERLFLFFMLFGKRASDFLTLDASQASPLRYKGYFYQKSVRLEKKEIRFLYHDYDTAMGLVQLLEGEGIRVVDLSKTAEKHCIIEESLDRGTPSQTARYLARIFSCPIGQKKERDLVVADIVVVLDDRIEKTWE